MNANLPDRLPICSKPGHGRMTLRPFAGQTYEQMWTGPWYDCLNVDNGQRCRSSATLFTDEAKAYAEAAKRGAR